ncbi:MAG: hypothetical protein V2I57_05410 [Xanthomonadales bacterium]|jgi:hypothetical protein|nr:hypothetical protein [Xanthomonadales bacterium]
MTEFNWPYRLAALAAAAVGVFLLLGSFGHLGATWPMVRETSLAGLLLLLPGIFLLGLGLFNLLATWGLWKGSPALYSAAVALNGIFLAYLAFLLVSGVPGHPLWFFTLMIGIYCCLLAAVRVKSVPTTHRPA